MPIPSFNPDSKKVEESEIKPAKRNVRGGMYGYRGDKITEEENKKIYNDDDPLLEMVKMEKKDAKIDI